jgi:hypothetical protein
LALTEGLIVEPTKYYFIVEKPHEITEETRDMFEHRYELSYDYFISEFNAQLVWLTKLPCRLACPVVGLLCDKDCE